eukprot:TRINITY_DN12951_c1_g2_i1.p1 TRINITY_DN12951_c1_g2~~TRINITY_DN12951_c1_g2_i1.p1  ORF type:complete len:639 (-),score=117.59 TRINITY_DN12951_c1_g2_i1:98-2014(-)
MVAISMTTISKELMLACRQLGHVVSDTLATIVACTVVNPDSGGFFSEKPIEENEAKMVVEEAAKRILAKEEPGISTLKLQASYESAFAEIEQESKSKQIASKAAEERSLNWISNFTAGFDQDFDSLTGLYKQIYNFLLLRCTSPTGASTAPKDQAVEREVAAALESVFPRVGLRSFVALTGAEKTAQLQELSGIVLGIRLFNQHQKKGGTGLPVLEGVQDHMKCEELLASVQKEADEIVELLRDYADLFLVAQNPPTDRPWEELPTEAEVDRTQSDLLYHRQYLCYLLNLQEDVTMSLDRLRREQAHLQEELIDLDALIGGRVSVPKEQVYPRFDALARDYRAAWTEVKALEARAKLHGILQDLRKQYFPRLGSNSQEMLSKIARVDGQLLLETQDAEGGDQEPLDLDSIPGPANSQDPDVAIRLTVDNCDNFLNLPLDFQGFCVHTLVCRKSLLVPGNPALGVVQYAGRYCVFATERAMAEFCQEPIRFFGGIREACYKQPELIHLLRVNEDFQKSSLQAVLQMLAGAKTAMLADAGTETPLHFQESNIDKNYEWNEWKLRREALHMADIRRKTTSTTQTALSHLRRENETQVYLPKEVATNTTASRGTNPPRLRKYYRHLRGEPQPMQVTELKFDL